MKLNWTARLLWILGIAFIFFAASVIRLLVGTDHDRRMKLEMEVQRERALQHAQQNVPLPPAEDARAKVNAED